jgi:hypothetical protein
VIAFQKPKAQPVAQPKPVSLADAEHRGEWMAALAAIWANPKNWRTSRHGNRYIVIDEIGVVVVINRTDEGYWSWEIRWRDGRPSVESNWTYTSERLARDEALDAVIVLA